MLLIELFANQIFEFLKIFLKFREETNIPKNKKLFLGINCTLGGNRTHTSEETGF